MCTTSGATLHEGLKEPCGAACLGNPLNAMAWLTGELARRKRPLRAGEIALSGALGTMVPVSPGDAFEASIAVSVLLQPGSPKRDVRLV